MLLVRSLPRPEGPDARLRVSPRVVQGLGQGQHHSVRPSETDAEYMPYTQRLSIKACWGGTERYFIDNRVLNVDDDSYLIFNDRRKYASSIRSERPVRSFSIFFRPGFAEEVLGGMLTPQDRILDRRRRVGARSRRVRGAPAAARSARDAGAALHRVPRRQRRR